MKAESCKHYCILTNTQYPTLKDNLKEELCPRSESTAGSWLMNGVAVKHFRGGWGGKDKVWSLSCALNVLR